ncbi:MAG TPA: orotidine-5'-phosphate decarboxylase [Bacteroidia bacterium]|nr:orotidine-5'-phosphate decarboxylase [Bacteroidia bacterium]
MTREQLIGQIKKKHSFLCIGLDTDLSKIPPHLKDADDPVFEFNREIIDATHSYCVAYKPNLAFYESLGPSGWISLEKTLAYIPEGIFTIADAKRGDIGNTSEMYARTFFDYYKFDSVTVAPYMGEDSVTPFLKASGKWVILLALTSNKGAADFQMDTLDSGVKVFEKVLQQATSWGNASNMMFVAGATRPEMFKEIRAIVPDHFLLVPGVGAQGGSLTDVCKYGLNSDCGLLVNASRSIIYASNGTDFAAKAGIEAAAMQQEMNAILKQAGF